MSKKIAFFLLNLFLLCLAKGQTITDPEVLQYNYCVGTINIYPTYGFTCDDRLVEGAKVILNMGSNSIKIELGPGKGPFTSGNDPGISTYGVKCTSDSDMVAIVRDDSSFKKVLDMPFTNYFFWARTNNKWLDGYSAQERLVDSTQFDAVAKYLLTHYNNSGKKFYFGNWEGDWLLRDSFTLNYFPTVQQCNYMVQWCNTRQNAIDAVKNSLPHQNVDIFHYLEGWTYFVSQYGMQSLYNQVGTINNVLPYTNVDYYSYSSYDGQDLNQTTYDSILNYIESKLPPKAGFTGKRVFIGELGQDRINWLGGSDSLHEVKNRLNIRKAIHWGTPFVWFWALYDGSFSYIDTANRKLPLYRTLSHFYQEAKKYVNNYKVVNGQVPSEATYLAWADNFLANPANFQNPPANDDCVNAFLIEPGTNCNPFIGDVAYATQSIPSFTCGASIAGTANDDVWFKFVATSTSMTIKVKPDLGFDPVVDLFDGCGGNFIGCSSTSGNSNATELVTANNLITGNTYYVRVYDWRAIVPAITTFNIYVYDIPVNDECPGAISLNENNTCIYTAGTAVNASQSQPGTNCGSVPAGTANEDVWFKFTANTTDATITVVPDQGFDAVVDLYDACGGNLVGCSSTPGGSQLTETIQTNTLTIGQTYYIRVYDWWSVIKSVNSFNICVYSPNSTGFARPANSGISIYPNPFSQQTSIHLSKNLLGSDLKVYNVYGQSVKEIYHITEQDMILSRENLDSGVYFVKLFHGNASLATYKVVVSE